MSDGDDSVAMSIEDAFAQTLSDMEDAREELASSPVLSESSSLNSAFEVGVPDVTEEPIEHNPVIAPTPSPPPVEVTPSLPPVDAPPGPPMMGPPAGPPYLCLEPRRGRYRTRRDLSVVSPWPPTRQSPWP